MGSGLVTPWIKGNLVATIMVVPPGIRNRHDQWPCWFGSSSKIGHHFVPGNNRHLASIYYWCKVCSPIFDNGQCTSSGVLRVCRRRDYSPRPSLRRMMITAAMHAGADQEETALRFTNSQSKNQPRRAITAEAKATMARALTDPCPPQPVVSFSCSRLFARYGTTGCCYFNGFHMLKCSRKPSWRVHS